MNKLVSTCLPCLASTETKHRDPLVPNEPPATPWTNLAADHWRPTPDGKHLLLVIDELTRYPELEVVSGTSADANIEAFDTMFCQHGYPETLNGWRPAVQWRGQSSPTAVLPMGRHKAQPPLGERLSRISHEALQENMAYSISCKEKSVCRDH